MRFTRIRHPGPTLGECGATAVEYALMVSLVALAIFGSVALIGPKLATIFNDVAASL
jgi:pilus assembly protein Flp/PilA